MGKYPSFRNSLVHVCPQSGLLLLLLPAKAPAFAFAGKVYHVALSYSSLINWRLPKMAIALTSFHCKEANFCATYFLSQNSANCPGGFVQGDDVMMVGVSLTWSQPKPEYATAPHTHLS